ncbi:hypothetical protein BDP27DRAFT_1452880 [Rhodocollybia butyracea]|uniref:Uncharacterized protein n=1 Tax=Rhodocollybia butyracea TaxID=206335 RepID=A0A9P5PCC6_9AGAR|nr:hypothetical protein BDP27DRAFT_1452880 [Rhodocollybia butyracea]
MLCVPPELTLAHMRQMAFPGTESQGNALKPLSHQAASSDLPMEGIPRQDHRPQKSLKSERSAPIPGVMVPDIPKHGKDLFMAIVKQWEEGDPSQGLMTPLKDWPVEWYTGLMRLVTGTKRSNRNLVADEYERDSELAIEEKTVAPKRKREPPNTLNPPRQLAPSSIPSAPLSNQPPRPAPDQFPLSGPYPYPPYPYYPPLTTIPHPPQPLVYPGNHASEPHQHLVLGAQIPASESNTPKDHSRDDSSDSLPLAPPVFSVNPGPVQRPSVPLEGKCVNQDTQYIHYEDLVGGEWNRWPEGNWAMDISWELF